MLRQLEGMSSASMLSDLQVGRYMAEAAVRGALANVTINLDSLSDAKAGAEARAKCAAIESQLSTKPPSARRS